MNDGTVVAVVPRPLADDFDVRADSQGVLGRLRLHVVENPASDDPELRVAEILITGISTQTASPSDLARAMPRLRWIHSMTAGVEELVSDELLGRQVLVTSGTVGWRATRWGRSSRGNA